MVIPNPSVWRQCIEYWPEAVRRHFATIAEKHEREGKSWKEAEWLAFQFICKDTARHERENPNKPISWHRPWKSPTWDCDSMYENSVLVDDLYKKEFKLACDLNQLIISGPNKAAKVERQPRKRKVKHSPDNKTMFSV